MVLAGLLSAIGLTVFWYKQSVLGFPLAPDSEQPIWTVEARVSFVAEQGPVTVSLQVPSGRPGFAILDESFISRGYGLDIEESDGIRRAVWTIRSASGSQVLYYRASVYRDRDVAAQSQPTLAQVEMVDEPFRTARSILIERVRGRSADVNSFAAGLLQELNNSSPDEDVALILNSAKPGAKGMARLSAELLRSSGFSAAAVEAIDLDEDRRRPSLVPMLEVSANGSVTYYDSQSAGRGLPEQRLVWSRGPGPVLRIDGGNEAGFQLAIQRSMTESLQIAEHRSTLRQSRLFEFSLFSLPITTQAVYAVMLLVPVGGFVMVVLRNVLGIKTFGTFMPVLIALAFRETRLVWGILLFTLVVALGLSIRFLLERLHLLLVPRLAAVLTVVVCLMMAISVISHRLGLETGFSVALFPLVILTMAIERLSIVWEERGALEALQEGFGSLLVAAICYLVMSIDAIEHVLFVFPELLLVVLAGCLALGRYRGYRLLELFRFKAVPERTEE